jgi:hypothetical protein
LQPGCFISVIAVGMDATAGHGCKVKNLRNARLLFHRSGELPHSCGIANIGFKHAIIAEL